MAERKLIGLLGAIFTYAIRHRMRADNPVHGVMRPADGRRERRLSDDEYKALGGALSALENDMWPAALRMCRFLSVTGWRTGEAQALRWRDVDLARRTATLPDSKSGRSVRPPVTPSLQYLATTGPWRRLGVPSIEGHWEDDRLAEVLAADCQNSEVAGRCFTTRIAPFLRISGR